jgi:hypothetical protein
MNARALGCFFSAQAMLAIASAQVVPVGGMGQHIIARNVVGIDCNAPNNPTGFGTAVLYFPYIAGIPEQYLFRPGATVLNETNATITAVFSRVETSETRNDTISNVFLKAHQILYYYHPNSSPRNWEDIDGFQTGELIAVNSIQRNMFTAFGGASFVINSGPWTFSKNFVLPDGSIANIKDFMPGGITVHVFGTLGKFVEAAPGRPLVADFRNSTGNLKLGSCAIFSPFSGSGTHPGPLTNSRSNGRRAVGDDSNDQ